MRLVRRSGREVALGVVLGLVRLGGVAALAPLAGCNDKPTSPSLTATCSASPSSGAAPLAVVFTLTVGGASSFDVAINYGDGTTSASLNLAHVYQIAGGYTATFSASSQGQSAACSTGVNVTGPAPTPTPSPTSNRPPSAVFRTTPAPGTGNIFTGQAPFAITFNMCPTTDVDLDVLLWTMDFDGDGKTEVRGSTGAACRRTNSYPSGTYRPQICVTDLDSSGNVRHDFQCKRYTVQVTP
jgi:PKD domain